MHDQIEEIRRRAKDAKASNVQYFLSLYFESFEKFRNTLFIISLSLFGYLGSIQKSLSFSEARLLVVSIGFGLLSYIFTSFIFLKKASYYSEIEKLYSTAYLSKEEYNTLLKRESAIKRNSNSYLYLLDVVHFSCVIFQLLFLMCAMWTISQI